MKKVAEITFIFWLMKICATTLGETAGDLLSMTLSIGYGQSSLILLGFFVVTLMVQLRSKKYNPILYWAVIVSTSTAGTTISDFMDRTLGLGYATGSLILVVSLVSMLSVWYLSEKSLSVSDIKTFRPEVFYWLTILISNTLGTALGDYLVDSSGMGYMGGATLIGSLIAIIALAYYFSPISHITLFWIAFVLTRPFGATFGDLLTKPIAKGGLNLGTTGSSVVLLSILLGFLFYEIYKKKKLLKLTNF
jgi:uncharacterized membrane-anchored protein